MPNPLCAAIGTNPPAVQACVVVSEFPLNNHQSFRAEIVTTNGRSVVRLSRWKRTAAGPRSTGQALEFGAHRASAVIRILQDVIQVMQVQQPPFDGPETASRSRLFL